MRDALSWGAPAALLATMVLSSALAPWLAPYDPLATDPPNQFAVPGGEHLLGTDFLGRDVLSRALWGGRASLAGAALATTLSVGLGLCIGGAAGMLSDAVDWVLMRAVDVSLAFPGLLLAIALVAMLGVGRWQVALAVGLSLAPAYSRLSRAAVLTVREHFYIEAARALGASRWWMFIHHVLPNIAGQMVTFGVVHYAWALLNIAALDFLGLSGSPSSPTWGTMLAEGREYLRVAPWVAVTPGAMLTLTVVSMIALGDAWQRTHSR
jgi:ABC-type dipeptide/oligopeptide/nickel transport system permease subunit